MIKKTVNINANAKNTLEVTSDLQGCLSLELWKGTVKITTLTGMIFPNPNGTVITAVVSPAQTTLPAISAKIQEILIANGYVLHGDGEGFGVSIEPDDDDFVITFYGEAKITSVSAVAVTNVAAV